MNVHLPDSFHVSRHTPRFRPDDGNSDVIITGDAGKRNNRFSPVSKPGEFSV
jgi:hypothetical protein